MAAYRIRQYQLIVLLLCSLIAQVGCTTSTANSHVPVEDQADIYAAVIHAIAFETPDGRLIEREATTYLVRSTNDETATLSRAVTDGLPLPIEVQDGVLAALDDLESPLQWVDSFGSVCWEDGHVVGFGQIVELGNLQEVEPGTYHVAASSSYGNLGAIGLTYIVSRVDGRWQITGTTGSTTMARRTGLTDAS